jgi:serine/threonine protein kinase
MARVHIGKLSSEGGFSRIVAIKVLHAQYAGDAEFRKMFLDEARLVAQIRHPNVVSTLDVLEDQGELFLVMDYVHGLPLSHLLRDVRRNDDHVPIPVGVSIIMDALEGLHAAHEARAESGVPLQIVHRDVSPQNVMVGKDGSAQVVDFGVAHAANRLQHTMPGQIKGKVSYMAPEQATGTKVDRRADIYAASVVLWETLAGQRLFQGETGAAIVLRHMEEQPAAPSSLRPEVSPELDAIVLRGLAKCPEERFSTAREMCEALEQAVKRAGRAQIASWLEHAESEFFAARDELLAGLRREMPDASPDFRDQATLGDGRVESDVPFESDLAIRVNGSPLVVVPAAPARSRRIGALTGASILVSLIALGALAARTPRLEHTASQPELSAVPQSSVAEVTAPVPPSVAAVLPPDPSTPVAAKTSTTLRRDLSAKHPSSLSPAPPPAPSPSCCTPDGRLRLYFYDCVNNCKK